jgi:methyl-accepting chemotaxis protein
MDNNNGQQETAVLVAQTLEDFRKGMEYREQLSVRTDRRTSQIIRMPALDNSVRDMDANLAGLNTDLHAMFEQIRYLNGNVAGMTNSVQVLNNQINNMNLTTGNMADSMHQLSKPMKAFPF